VKLIQEFRTYSIVPDVRNKRRIFDGNSVREKLLGRHRCRRKKNIKTDLKVCDCAGTD
jgi:hypothetical protein